MEAKNITRDKLLRAGFDSGTDMGDGRIEYYWQKVNTKLVLEKEFYLWDMNGNFMLEMLWEGYESEINIEVQDWNELEMLFFAFTREKLTLKNEG